PHGDVVFLHRRRRDRVDTGRVGQPLELGHDRGLRVLGDHVPAVHTGVVGKERVEAVAAGDVEEPVGAPLADARQIGDSDGEAVQDVDDRSAVEVAVGFDASVERDDGIVYGTGQFAACD